MTLEIILQWADKIRIYIPFVNFLIASVTFILLWNMKRKFIFRSGLDDHKSKVIAISSELSTLLAAYTSNKQEIDEQLALADVELRSMLNGADGNLTSDVKEARALIKKYKYIFWFIRSDKNKTEKLVREIKTSLSVIAAELDNVRKHLLVGR